MDRYDGINDENTLIAGEIEEDRYVLTQFKHMRTQSVISKERMEAICNYLTRELDKEEQDHFITINDQLPVRVSKCEMIQLLVELKAIKQRLS
ncbi:hypothetical protein ACLM5H_19365 [Fredinandcohnia humi]